MTKERTKEDWEHEGWIVGDGSLVGEERAGFYDMTKPLNLGGDFDFYSQMAMLDGCIFVRGCFYKLVRPLPMLPEPGCAERAVKASLTTGKYKDAPTSSDSFASQKERQHLSTNDDDLPEVIVDHENKPMRAVETEEVEPVSGRWYVVKNHVSGWSTYAKACDIFPPMRWIVGKEEYALSEFKILAESPSPEELVK